MKKRILTLGVVLALVVALVVPTAVLAQTTGTDTTEVSGNLAETYAIEAPAAQDLVALVVSTITKTGLSLTAATNNPSMMEVGITVEDAKVNNKGYLTLGGADAADAVKLTNALGVKGGAITLDYLALTATRTLATAAVLDAGSYTINNFAISQQIVTLDLAKTAGDYSLVMTFTATFVAGP